MFRYGVVRGLGIFGKYFKLILVWFRVKKKKRYDFYRSVFFLVKLNLGEIDLKCVMILKKKLVDKIRLGEFLSFFCFDDIVLIYRIYNKYENSIL